MATCKKIEVDYFAKRAAADQQPNELPNVDSVAENEASIGYDYGSPIIIPSTDDDNDDNDDDGTEEKTVQKIEEEKHEESLHGAWEKEQLKIVEDYDTDKNVGDNCTQDSSSSSCQIVENDAIVQSVGIGESASYSGDHNKSNSNLNNLSLELIKRSETDELPQPQDDAKVEGILDLFKKRKQEFDEDDHVKRQKIIVDDSNTMAAPKVEMNETELGKLNEKEKKKYFTRSSN